MARRQIAGGAWVGIKIDGILVALAAGCSYNEDFQVQPANVINHLGPISYDSQGYSCNITIDLLVARDKQNILQVVPTRSDVARDGKMPENTVEFVDTADQKVLNSFSGVVLSTDASTIAPNTYVTANLAYLAMERIV